jgi:hypothetical protein
LSGCYTIRYHHRGDRELRPREQWHNSLFFGLWDATGPIQVDRLCPNGVASVENQVTFLNGLVAYLVEGLPKGLFASTGRSTAEQWAVLAVTAPIDLWSPSTVRVTCLLGRASPEGPPTYGGPPAYGYSAPPGAFAAPPPGRAPIAPQGQPPNVPGGAKRKALKMAVTKLVARTGVTQPTVDLYSDALIGELRKHGVVVLSEQDITEVIGHDKKKQLLGCTENTNCLAEIGGALGVDRLVHGTIGWLGRSLVVNLSSVDPKVVRVVASVSERLKNATDESFLDALPSIVDQLIMEGGVVR